MSVLGRPRNTIADERIKDLLSRGHGGKFIFKRLSLDGFTLSRATIQRRLRELKKTG